MVWWIVLPIILSPIAYALYVAWDFFTYPVFDDTGRKLHR